MRRYSSLWHDDDDQALKRNKLAYMVYSKYVCSRKCLKVLHRVATETIGTSHSGACHYHSVVAARDRHMMMPAKSKPT